MTGGVGLVVSSHLRTITVESTESIRIFSSNSDNEHRSFDRAESKRCHNASRRQHEEYASSDEDDEEIAVRGRHRIRLRTFDGSGTFETFWAHFENCASYNRWNNADKLAHLKASLVGDAGQVLWDSDPSSVNTLSKLVQLLKARFEGSRQADKHRMELRLRRRKSGETLTELHRDIRRLMALAHPSLTETAREEIACDYFVDTLDNPDFALKVRERAPATLDDALRIALQLEAWTKDAQRKTEEREKHKFKTRGSEVTESTLETRLSRLESQVGSFQPSSKTARPERQRPMAPSATTAASSNKTPDLDLKRLKEQIENDIRESLKAEIRQEMQRDLERKQPVLNAKPAMTSRSEDNYGGPPLSTPPYGNPGQSNRSYTNNQRDSGYRVCWNCGIPGHIRRDCILPPQTATAVETPSFSQPSRPAASARGSKMKDRANVYLPMEINGRSFPCLLDSGCEQTMMPRRVIQKCGIEIEPTEKRVFAANESELSMDGEAEVALVLNNQTFMTRTLVTPDIEEIMLGSDWLTAQECLWDFRTGKIVINGQPATPVSRKGPLLCQRVFVEQDVVIPPRKETAVPARTTLVTPRTYTETGMVEARKIQSGVYLGRTMLPPWHRGMAVRIANTTDKPVTLTSDTFLGQVIPVEIVSGQEHRSVPMKPPKPHHSYDPNSNEIRIRDAYKVRVIKETTEY